ncbi:hypothetical protein [Rubritalea tangerina]|uniref:Inner membrane protein YqiJ N-terminal domain-containing protein n=1 Tax=Rubritalea tangerina TaxID=430798 RepID=A0ABW4ZBM1_9BACT
MAKRTIISCSRLVVKEILEISILPYMLPVTAVLVIISFLLLLSVVTGGLADGFDLDFDAEVEADGSGGIFDGFLHFVNADKVPTMLVLAFFSVFLWMAGIALTALFNPHYDNWIGIGLLVGGFIVSVLCTRFAVMPFIPLFRYLKQGEDNGVKIEGHRGTVKSIELTEEFGQVEIIGPDGPVLLNAKLTEGSAPLKRGDDVVVIERSEDGKFCFVAHIEI